MGPSALVGDDDSLLLRGQAGVAITGTTLFLLACVVAERRRVARERTAWRRELQQAIAEIKTLRVASPG